METPDIFSFHVHILVLLVYVLIVERPSAHSKTYCLLSGRTVVDRLSSRAIIVSYKNRINMMSKSSADRSRLSYAKYTAAGLILQRIWTHPDDAAANAKAAGRRALTRAIFEAMKN